MSETPKKIGPYHIVSKIGEGGLSDVYLVLKEGTPYALKCLKPERARVVRHIDDFIREVKIATTLKHPNLLSFIDSGKLDSTYFGVMEAVVGITTYELLMDAKKTHGKIPVSIVLFIVKEMLKAFSYMHRTTVFENSTSHTFHGDLSPANILIAQDGRVLLTDFGSAGQNTAADPQNAHLGKMYYLPGDVLDRGAVTTETDLYSLAAVTFYLLFGERPFEAKEKYDLYRHIKNRDVPRLDCTNITRTRKDDSPLRIFFNKALNKDKALRFKTAQEFYDAFFAVHFAENAPESRLEFIDQLNRVSPNLFVDVASSWKERIEYHRNQEFKKIDRTPQKPVESLLARVDKRKHPRVSTQELNLKADVFASDNQIRVNVSVVELSQGGMLVRWEGLMPKIGKEYPILMKLDDSSPSIEAKGKLLYEVHRQAKPHAAFKFVNLLQGFEDQLKGFVYQRLGGPKFSQKIEAIKEESTSEDFVEIFFRSPGEFKDEYDRNIRHGGMFVQSNQYFQTDQEVLIRLQISNQLGRAVLKGRIVQCTPLEKGKAVEKFGLGIQLGDTPEKVKALLEEYFDLKL